MRHTSKTGNFVCVARLVSLIMNESPWNVVLLPRPTVTNVLIMKISTGTHTTIRRRYPGYESFILIFEEERGETLELLRSFGFFNIFDVT